MTESSRGDVAKTTVLARMTVVVSSTASDSHMWNLVYLQLLLEELGCAVTNLGSCVSDETLVEECRCTRPNLVVISTVNGHGYTEGMRLARRLTSCPELAGTSLTIGGKLGIAGTFGAAGRNRLLAAGFDAVFDDGDVTAFCAFLDRLANRVVS
jgi:methylaspartate mutase sigma subunit